MILYCLASVSIRTAKRFAGEVTRTVHAMMEANNVPEPYPSLIAAQWAFGAEPTTDPTLDDVENCMTSIRSLSRPWNHVASHHSVSDV